MGKYNISVNLGKLRKYDNYVELSYEKFFFSCSCQRKRKSSILYFKKYYHQYVERCHLGCVFLLNVITVYQFLGLFLHYGCLFNFSSDNARESSSFDVLIFSNNTIS